jgi:hypothetical protein
MAAEARLRSLYGFLDPGAARYNKHCRQKPHVLPDLHKEDPVRLQHIKTRKIHCFIFTVSDLRPFPVLPQSRTDPELLPVYIQRGLYSPIAMAVRFNVMEYAIYFATS